MLRYRAKGYTLVEATISVAIASLLLVALTTFYTHMHRAGAHGEQALDTLQDVQSLMAHLVADLKSLAPPSDVPPDRWVEFDDVDGDGRLELAFWRWDSMDPDTGEADRVKVEYEVNLAPDDSYLRRHREDGLEDDWLLARGGLREFQAQAFFSYWSDEGGGLTYHSASITPPEPEDTIDRIWVNVSYVVEQFKKSGEPTTELPISVNVCPREFNLRLHQHWIEDE